MGREEGIEWSGVGGRTSRRKIGIIRSWVGGSEVVDKGEKARGA